MKNLKFLLVVSLISFTLISTVSGGGYIVESMKKLNGFHKLNPEEHEELVYHHKIEAENSFPILSHWHKTWANEHFKELEKYHQNQINEVFHKLKFDNEVNRNQGHTHQHYDIETGHREIPKGSKDDLSTENRQDSGSALTGKHT